jgi:hypothetical protein
MTSTSSDPDGQAIAAVRTGMRVVDSAGAEVGTVEHVDLGQPGALTADLLSRGEAGSFPEHVVESVSGPEPDVPPARVEELVRHGYVKVDRGALTDVDMYVAAGEIADVAEGVVRLTVRQNQLVTET